MWWKGLPFFLFFLPLFFFFFLFFKSYILLVLYRHTCANLLLCMCVWLWMLSTPICMMRVTMETNGIGREKEEHQGKRGSAPPDTVLVDEKIRMEEKADSKDIFPSGWREQIIRMWTSLLCSHRDVITGKCWPFPTEFLICLCMVQADVAVQQDWCYGAAKLILNVQPNCC